MKKIMLILAALVSLLFVSAIYAHDGDGKHSVLINSPSAQITVSPFGGVYVQTTPVVRYRLRPHYVIPVQPQNLVVPPPLKPQFKTPLRNGVWYGTYYSRVWRLNRLGRILNVQQAPPILEIPPVVPPTDPQPPTPRDP